MEQLMDQQLDEDSAHYEISLTAGQAFVAFVLLLLSLAASFAFGIMLGRGRGDAIPLVEAVSPAVSEVATIDVDDPVPAVQPSVIQPKPVTTDAAPADDFVIEPVRESPSARATEAVAPVATPSTDPIPHFAQLASTSDSRTAEALAARLIDDGFSSAYVERNETDKGMIHRVRVRFHSEAEARAAVPQLTAYTTEKIWVTRYTN
jgi:cell division septation protein DedD